MTNYYLGESCWIPDDVASLIVTETIRDRTMRFIESTDQGVRRNSSGERHRRVRGQAMTEPHDRPLHMCLDCGKPIWLSFMQRGDGYVHAECEIRRLTEQRNTLLEVLRKWVWICDGRTITAIDWNERWEAAEAATLEAIAAYEEKP